MVEQTIKRFRSSKIEKTERILNDFKEGKITFDVGNKLLKSLNATSGDSLQDALFEINAMSPSAQIVQVIEFFIDENPVYFDTKTRIWWLWNSIEKKWEISNDEDILRLFKNRYSFTDWLHSALKSQLLTALQVCAERKPQSLAPDWIQFKDKAINILTGEEIDPTPEMFFTNPIPHNIGDSEETPTIDRFFADWVGEKYTKMLYEMLAYTLYRSYPIHRIFFLVGSGRNGKTTFLKLLTNFVGEKNRISTDLTRLKQSRFESAKLLNKLICEISETSINILYDASILKAMTGESYLPAEIKQKDLFDFLNFSKLFISTNSLPVTSDTSDGFYRRALVIEFPRQFPETNDVLASVSETEYENLSRKCVNILKELLKTMKFSGEGDVDDRKARYETMSNPIRNFVEERCIEEFGAYITKADFKSKLSDYLTKIGHYKRFTTQQINKILTHMGIEAMKQKVNNAENPLWVLSGIRLRTEEELSTSISKKSTIFNLVSHIENLVENNGNIGILGTENNEKPEVKENGVHGVPKEQIQQGILNFLGQLEAFKKDLVSEEELIGLYTPEHQETITKNIVEMKRLGMLFEPRAGFLKVV